MKNWLKVGATPSFLMPLLVAGGAVGDAGRAGADVVPAVAGRGVDRLAEGRGCLVLIDAAEGGGRGRCVAGHVRNRNAGVRQATAVAKSEGGWRRHARSSITC